MLENIDVMTSGLKSHIQLSETNWQGIFEDELKSYLTYLELEQDRQERQEQIRQLENQLENQKETDQKARENTRKEIDRLKQEVRDMRSKQHSTLPDILPLTTVSTLAHSFTLDAIIAVKCERCGRNFRPGMEGGTCKKCKRQVCDDCVAQRMPIFAAAAVSIPPKTDDIICKDCFLDTS